MVGSLTTGDGGVCKDKNFHILTVSAPGVIKELSGSLRKEQALQISKIYFFSCSNTENT